MIYEKSLSFLMPQLAQEWNSIRNKGITPNNVTAFSHKTAWWICKFGHEWEAIIKNRSNGNGCPYCSGRYPTPSNCLATIYPEASKEWNYIKNNGLTPYEVTPSSGKKVWWICTNGHEWEALISNRIKGQGCPYCNGKRPTESNCLATVNPNLAKEWHPTKNGYLKPHKVTPSSGKKVWWQCVNGHEWKSSIHSRARNTRSSKCPECNKRIRTSFPEQAVYYYLSKLLNLKVVNNYKCNDSNSTEIDIFIESLNLGIEYDGYHHGSPKAVLRDIKKNKIINKQGIQLIRIREEGLPIFNLSDLHGCLCLTRNDNDSTKSLEKCIYELLNIIKNNYSQLLDTACINILHEYKKTDDIQIDSNRPFINELLPSRLFANSFDKIHPELLNEWNFVKNRTLTPEQVSFGSSLRVWWICQYGHEWDATIGNRSNGFGCPYCAGQKVSIENCLTNVNPNLSKEWHPAKNGDLKPNNFTAVSSKKAWWLCQKGHEWETSIQNRANGNGCPYCAGNKKLSIDLMRSIAEQRGGKCLSDTYVNVGTKLLWQCSEGHTWQARPNRIRHDEWCPICRKNKRFRNKKIINVEDTDIG